MDSRGSLDVASRTDRGVSAVANALVLDSALSGAALLRALNGTSPRIFFTGARVVPMEFRVRHALMREYRYYAGVPFRVPGRVAEAASRLTGRVDVRSLGRQLPSTTPTWREVESVRIEQDARTVVVRAPSFVWGMVRKIVGALRAVDAGRLSLARLTDALEGRVRLTLPMAEPGPLVLWEVSFGLPWDHIWRGPNRQQALWWSSASADAAARARVLAVLPPAVGASAD